MSDTSCLQLTPNGSVPSLTVTLSATPTSVIAGEQIVWTAVIANNGTGVASGVTLSATLAGTWTPAGPYTINPGQTVTATMIHTATAPEAVTGSVANTVTINATTPGGGTVTAVSPLRTVTVSAVIVNLCQPWRRDALCTAGSYVPLSTTGHVVTFNSKAQFDSLKSTLVPGDIFKATADIDGQCYLRGNNVDGGGSNIDGSPGNHITITANPGVVFRNTSLVDGAIDIAGCNHVDVLNCTIESSQFGIRYLSVNGTADSRCRIAGNTVRNTTDAHIVVQGWFASPWSPSSFVDVICNEVYGQEASQRNPWFTEGIYCGHGTPRWVDFTHDIGIYGNHIHHVFSDGIEIKPGVTNFAVEDNLLHDLNFLQSVTGDIATAAITIWYQDISGGSGGGALVPPGGVNTANGRVRRNRIYGLSGVNGGLRPIIVGYGGVDIQSNIAWGYPTRMCRLQSEQAYAPTSVTPAPITYSGNTGGGLGFETVNTSGAPLPTVVSTDNIPDQYASPTFVGPITGTAEQGGQGAGSGFVLSPTSSPTHGTAGGIDATGCTRTGTYPMGALTTSGANAVTSFGGVATGSGAAVSPVTVRGVASPHMAPSITIHTTDFTVTPVSGDKLIFITAGPGPSALPGFTLSRPAGTVIKLAPGSGHNPYLEAIWIPYDGVTTSWTFSTTSATDLHVIAIAVTGAGSSMTASAAPTYGLSPQDPGPCTNTAGALGLAVFALKYTGATFTGPPTGHTVTVNAGSSTGYRPMYVAQQTLMTAGTYDPGPAAVGPPPNADLETTFAIAVNPV